MKNLSLQLPTAEETVGSIPKPQLSPHRHTFKKTTEANVPETEQRVGKGNAGPQADKVNQINVF